MTGRRRVRLSVFYEREVILQEGTFGGTERGAGKMCVSNEWKLETQ